MGIISLFYFEKTPLRRLTMFSLWIDYIVLNSRVCFLNYASVQDRMNFVQWCFWGMTAKLDFVLLWKDPVIWSSHCPIHKIRYARCVGCEAYCFSQVGFVCFVFFNERTSGVLGCLFGPCEHGSLWSFWLSEEQSGNTDKTIRGPFCKLQSVGTIVH